MKKRVLILVLLSFMVAGVVSAASLWGAYKGNAIVKVKVDGTAHKTSGVPAIVYNGQTMLPLNVLKSAGVQYSWNAKSLTVDITKPKQKDTRMAIAYAKISERMLQIQSTANLTYQQLLLNSMIYNAVNEKNAIGASDSDILKASSDQVNALKAISPGQAFKDSIKPIYVNYDDFQSLIDDLAASLEDTTSALIAYKQSMSKNDYDGAIASLQKYSDSSKQTNSLIKEVSDEAISNQTMSSEMVEFVLK